MRWYRELDAIQRRGFWACFGGWALDAMDVQIYALVLPIILALWHLSKTQAGFAATVALLFSSVGGAAAGYLADRVGRVRVLQICILWFSAFTFLSGLTQNYGQLLAARALQGLGFGGEWAAGAVLMAEIISARSRGKAVAAVSSGWAVGYGVAALLFTITLQFVPREIAWRLLFFVGILPALLVIYVQRSVHESPMYLSAREQGAEATRFADLFRGQLARRTLLAWAVCLGVLGGNYTILNWLPTYLQSERGLSYSNTGLYLLVNIAGSFCGYVLGGYISDGLGRRNALKLFAILGTLSVLAYLGLGRSALAVLALGFPLGFAQSGMNAGVAPLLSELFPTRLRASGQGLCYNAGRGVGAFFPTIVGLASVRMGLTAAIAGAAAVAYAIVLIASFFLPETANQLADAMAPGKGESR